MLLILSPMPSLANPDYYVREQAHKQLDNIIAALLLPNDHHDPEVRDRITRIKVKHLGYYSAINVEKRMFKYNMRIWLENHLVSGDSLIYTRLDFLYMVRDKGLTKIFLEAYPSPFGIKLGYLQGMVFLGEDIKLQIHLNFYDRRRTALNGLLGGTAFTHP